MLQIRGPKETFPVLKASDVISMYRLVIVLSGEVMLTELFIVIRYRFSGGFQGPQSFYRLGSDGFLILLLQYSTVQSFSAI